jgi:hypothetical protein
MPEHQANVFQDPAGFRVTWTLSMRSSCFMPIPINLTLIKQLTHAREAAKKEMHGSDVGTNTDDRPILVTLLLGQFAPL